MVSWRYGGTWRTGWIGSLLGRMTRHSWGIQAGLRGLVAKGATFGDDGLRRFLRKNGKVQPSFRVVDPDRCCKPE
jgi:hypothetical protein